jgi:peptidoglycan DL-endopeptidase CwlO
MDRSTAGWAPIVVFLAALAAGLALAVGPASADPSIGDKQAQAQAIIAEIQQLEMDIGVAAEAYDGARLELQQIEADLATNTRHLKAAKKSLGVAQRRIEDRLRDLYVNGSSDSTLEVLLGARSLDDIISRLDTIERVSHQDARVLREVRRFRAEVAARQQRLEKAQKEQARAVAEKAAQKAAIESSLAHRQDLLGSVKDEIAQMRAAEQARQAQLAAEARARLEAERLAALQAQNETVDSTFSAPEVVTTTAPLPDGSQASQVVAIAMQYLGVPYVWGGSSPSTGFDCSGFVAYVYAQIGIYLPHHAASQYNYGLPVAREDLQPGDLVFFNGLGHMGMYIGAGQFIHAPHTGDVVKISSLYEDWYASTFVGARRIL